MSDGKTTAQKLGEMAAKALDDLEGDLIGAVLLVATTAPSLGDDYYQTLAVAPDGQFFPTTLGIVEGWRLDQIAGVTASAVALEDDDDDDDDDD